MMIVCDDTGINEEKILKDFYVGHLRITWTKSPMMNFVYWPIKDKEIKDVVKHFRCCAIVSKAPNQAAEHGACVLTTCRSKKCGIQLTTANQTNHSLLFFSFKQLFSPSLTALQRANFRKSFKITLVLLTAPSSYQHMQTSSSFTSSGSCTFQLPAPADQRLTRRWCSSQHQLQTSSSLTQQPFLRDQATRCENTPSAPVFINFFEQFCLGRWII